MTNERKQSSNQASQTNAKAQADQPPGEPASKGGRRYTLRTRLREETEAPFRKARMFVYAGSALSAGVGAFISSLRVLSAMMGTRGVQPLSETVPNVLIDGAVIALCGILLWREGKAGETRLERMSRGARIAALRIEDVATGLVVFLKDVRGSKRVVVVAGSRTAVTECVGKADALKADLQQAGLLVMPCVLDDDAGRADFRKEFVALGWRFFPFAMDEWLAWLQMEREVMQSRLSASDDDGVFVIVVRLDGKVGARSVGAPSWPRLLQEVSKLPPKDQYGKP